MITLRPARRTEAKPLIGLYSLSGMGKTKSALYLARGFAGPQGKIAMIETESGRGEAYQDEIEGGYLIASLRDDFGPQRYDEALTACEKEKVDAVIIDSASHEWEANGGVLSMASDNEAKGWKGQIVWTKPKMEHARHFMLRLLGTPIPLVIVCMRAKYPMEEFINEKGKKDMRRSGQLVPKQSEDILYELFVHGWIDAEHRFQGTKYTRDDLRPVLVSGERINYETGRRLAQWSKGGDAIVRETSGAGDTEARPVASPDRAELRASDEKALRDQGSLATLQEVYTRLIDESALDEERSEWVMAETRACKRAIKAAEAAA